MSILRKPYEISIWDDYLIEDKGYYDEKKIAIIGSNTLTAPWRASNPVFTQNVNGSNTLTFTMYTHYYDDDTQTFEENPFVKMMVNERKIKLKYDGEWTDFIVKNIQESSDKKSYTYTCKDLFINELSKNGYNLQFDAELENNIGTIYELAERVLEGSDWRVKNNGEIFIETKEEPLYTYSLREGESIELFPVCGGEAITVESGKIYCFYSSIANHDQKIQTLYSDKELVVDDNRVILNATNYYWTPGQILPSFSTLSEYRGNKIVDKAYTIYDPIMDKYVKKYKVEDKTVHGYTESEYITSAYVENYIVNPSNFTSLDGWNIASKDGDGTLALGSSKKIEEITSETDDFYSFLDWNGVGQIVNPCLTSHRSKIRDIPSGKEFALRIDLDGDTPDKLLFKICKYKLEDGTYSPIQTYITFDNLEKEDNTQFYRGVATFELGITYEEFLNERYGLLITSSSSSQVKIKEIQFFEALYNNGQLIPPGTIISSEAKTKYYYYYADPNAKSIDELIPYYIGYEPAALEAESGYEKKRALTGSASNRFNLIQSLCETFQCWAKFEIEHEENGKISLDADHRQKKWISFHEYVGRDNHVGFKYGINLNSIQRTLDSEPIISKLIVKANSNQYAEGGFCSITTADENPSKESFLLDFSYYIRQGLLKAGQVDNDLYVKSEKYIGYYSELRRLNEQIVPLTEEKNTLVSSTIPNLQSQKTSLEKEISKTRELIESNKTYILSQTGFTYEQLLRASEEDEDKAAYYWKITDSIKGRIAAILQLKNNLEQIERQFEVIELSFNEVNTRLDEINKEIEVARKTKEELNSSFYKRYSRFIQEGAWTSESYIDDNLYYLDAESTLHTSSQPKVTYTIRVLELSQVEGYELYSFKIGDKTFIEDTEFFGWVYKNNYKTPYKEEVITSEVKILLDQPEQNTLTIKNYKTQFEDLFQRIAATTASVQFSTGDYQRAAAAIQQNGTINPDVMQNSLLNNNFTITNSHNESVVMNESGITTTSLVNPNEMVRIVGGGIFLSNDYGATWRTGITGNGISADYLTSGSINTKKIIIWNGDVPSFRWEPRGLTAYHFTENEDGSIKSYDSSTFVRYDRFGLYGIKNKQDYEARSEGEISKDASFYLTWNGFGFNTDDGSVSISSTGPITISENGAHRVELGKLDEDWYGLRIFDKSGNQLFATAKGGELEISGSTNVTKEDGSSIRLIDMAGGIGITCRVECPTGFIYSKTPTENIELIARIYDGSIEKDLGGTEYTYTWYIKQGDITIDPLPTGKIIYLSLSELTSSNPIHIYFTAEKKDS